MLPLEQGKIWIDTSKTGRITITVIQSNGIKFKTLAKNVTKIN